MYSFIEKCCGTPYLHLCWPSFIEKYLPFWSIKVDRKRIEDEALPELTTCFENIPTAFPLMLEPHFSSFIISKSKLTVMTHHSHVRKHDTGLILLLIVFYNCIERIFRELMNIWSIELRLIAYTVIGKRWRLYHWIWYGNYFESHNFLFRLI